MSDAEQEDFFDEEAVDDQVTMTESIELARSTNDGTGGFVAARLFTDDDEDPYQYGN